MKTPYLIFALAMAGHLCFAQQAHVVNVVAIAEPPCSDPLNSKLSQNTYHVFPSPASDFLTIEQEFHDASLTLIGINGQIVLMKKAGELTSQLDIRGIPSGMYVLHIEHSSGTFRGKVYIQN